MQSKEEKKEYNKQWYDNNKEKRKQYIDTNKEKIKEYNKQWHIDNKEHIKQYRIDNQKEIKEKRKLYKSNKKEEIKRYDLKHRYNITLEQYTEFLNKQEGKCAICHNQFKSTKDTHIDHNHITKKVRGLLCFKCNRGLGYFNDNKNTLNNASKYINDND